MRLPGADAEAQIRAALSRGNVVLPRDGHACVVWLDSTHWGACADAAIALLDATERARAARFRFAHDRRTYTLAHAVWRVLLARCMEIDIAAVPLQFRPSGQPYLSGTPLATSLSHSRSGVLIVIAVAPTVGIDIEATPPRISLGELMPTICAPAEFGALEMMAPAMRERALLRLWTRKEALLKACGSGLTRSPSSFVANDDTWFIPLDRNLPRCQARDLALPPGWVGALALPGQIRHHDVHRLEAPRSDQ